MNTKKDRTPEEVVAIMKEGAKKEREKRSRQEDIRLTEEEILGLCSPKYSHEIAFAEFVKANRAMGYGRMMQIISGIWFKQDKMGAILPNHTYGKPDEEGLYLYHCGKQ